MLHGRTWLTVDSWQTIACQLWLLCVPCSVPCHFTSHHSLCLLLLCTLLPCSINVVIYAAVSVFAGSWRSVQVEPPEGKEIMTHKEAAKFPIVSPSATASLLHGNMSGPQEERPVVMHAFDMTGCLRQQHGHASFGVVLCATG